MEVNRIFVFIFLFAILASCSNRNLPAQKKLTYKTIYYNWTYDSIKNTYILTDYPMGMRRIYPNFTEYKFNDETKIASISGKIIYPNLSNSYNPPVGNAPIISAISLEKKLFLHKQSSLGMSDNDGNFSINISDPPARFFILFSKDSLLPAAVEFFLR